MMNLDTADYRIIADDGSANSRPSMDGDLVAYESNALGNFDVYLYRISTAQTFAVTDIAGDQELNDVFGDMVAYVDASSGNEDIYVTRLNEQPVVDPGIDQTVPRGQAATLDGSGSTDPDGDYPLSYQWRVEFAPFGSTVQPADPTAPVTSFVPDLVGYYTISLTVTDAAGARGGPEWITISTLNAAPVAEAGPDQVINLLGELIQFDGSQSYDPDGDDIQFAWTLEQVPAGSTAALANATTATPSLYADVQGDYAARLTVTDSMDASSEDTVTASFNNLPPVADAGTSGSALVGDTVTLDGSGSYDPNDPDGINPLNYQWRFVSVPNGSTTAITPVDAVMASFVPDVHGLYIIELVVNDGELDSEPSIIQVQVISNETAVTESVGDIQEVNASLDPGVFRNGNMQSTLNNKLNAVISAIAEGDYVAARDKLIHDILAKTDGCAIGGAPDKNDWVRDCESQALLYPLILETIALLNGIIGG
jgi:hypothetical protein